MATSTVAEAPGSSAGTAALPATVPSTLTSTVVAAERAVPALRTVALTVTASRSLGAAGVQSSVVTVRSGAGAAVPTTWNSATCPPGAPELAVKCRRTSDQRPLTGTVTVLPPAGLKEYDFVAASEVKPLADCCRPRTWKVWVRAAHTGSGLSLTTTPLTSASAPSATVRSEG